jgi:hypothetical protein
MPVCRAVIRSGLKSASATSNSRAISNVFDLRDRLVGDYASYTRSFIKIADPRISDTVESALNAGAFWPEPLLQLNPTFLPGGMIDELVADGTLHPECAKIFRIDKSDTDRTGKELLLHTHQREAILKAKEKEGKSYVLAFPVHRRNFVRQSDIAFVNRWL